MNCGHFLSRISVRNSLSCFNLIHFRQGHKLRGKPPGVAKTLEQRLLEESNIDAELVKRIDIGFPGQVKKRSEILSERLKHLKAQRSNPELEKKARSNSLLINIEETQKEYRKHGGQFHLRDVADHYGIFTDLYGYAYFVPRASLSVMFPADKDSFNRVYSGNMLKPSSVKIEPKISFDDMHRSGTDDFYTLIMTNLDNHHIKENSEMLHWFISNIPGDKFDKGELIAPYLQPFPARGLGFQRFVFVLYKQHKGKIDFTEFKLEKNLNLEKRIFSTLEMYKKYQDKMTPLSLSFFLSDWDKSVTEFYHKTLDSKEPIYEYDFPRPYLADQKWFPLRQPFNLYMDKYRDSKKVNKEFLERKLAKIHPFNGPKPELKFPNAHPLRGIPSWLKTEIRKERLKIGRINDY